jgi:hypothetical protein
MSPNNQTIEVLLLWQTTLEQLPFVFCDIGVGQGLSNMIVE